MMHQDATIYFENGIYLESYQKIYQYTVSIRIQGEKKSSYSQKHHQPINPLLIISKDQYINTDLVYLP